MHRRFITPIGDLTLKPVPGQREIRFRPAANRAYARPRQGEKEEESHG